MRLSEEGYLAVNGMSYHARDIQCQQRNRCDGYTDDFESDHPLAVELHSRENWKRQLTKQEKEKNSVTEIRGILPECDRKRKGKDPKQKSGIRDMSHV